MIFRQNYQDVICIFFLLCYARNNCVAHYCLSLVIRERLEAEQEKVVRHLPPHNHSRDSAIDTDLQEWEIETLHISIVSSYTGIPFCQIC